MPVELGVDQYYEGSHLFLSSSSGFLADVIIVPSSRGVGLGLFLVGSASFDYYHRAAFMQVINTVGSLSPTWKESVW